MDSCDIHVSGGGIAGLATACAFGAAGFKVVCADPAPPVTDGASDGADLRSTALLQPARDVLIAAGVWDRLAPHGTPLDVMQIVDAGGPTGGARVMQDFRAEDLSDAPFGWNFPNWLLQRELLARLAELDRVDFRPGVATAEVSTRTGEALVRLSDGTGLRARLVIAADGRDSPIRRAAGIGVRTRRYGQKALAFAVTHPIPHENTSTEIHRSGGPFTLVPLPDLDGKPSSAVVWMEDGPRAEALARMEPAAFEAEMTERSCNILGPLTLVSRRSVWPIISQEADRLTAERIALIAEAAHVMPPIGAQGLNMSLRDLATLLDLAEARPESLGDSEMLDRYARARRADIALRVTGIDMLNRISQSGFRPLQDARALGLQVMHQVRPVRRTLMRLGLGLR